MSPREKSVTEVKSEKKRRLTLHSLLKQGKEVWVRNMTGNKEKGIESGVVALQIGRGPDADKLWIPAGNDPICLTDQVDPDSLKSCRDLFRAIDRGGLELLDPDDAEQYYEETQRRDLVKAKVDRLRFSQRDITQRLKVREESSRREEKEVKSVTEILHQKVPTICMQLKKGGLEEADGLEKLMEQENAMGAVDFEYIKANGHFASIKDWAADHLEE